MAIPSALSPGPRVDTAQGGAGGCLPKILSSINRRHREGWPGHPIDLIDIQKVFHQKLL